jgi:Zn-dependent protease
MLDNLNLNQIVVMIVPLLFSVTIHEVAHGYVALRMGDNTARLAGRLTLNPIKHLDFFGSLILPLILKLTGSPVIFGYAKPVPVNFSNFRDIRKGTIYVASAGVLANFILAILSGALFQTLVHFQSVWYPSIFKPLIMDLYHMLFYSVVINLVLGIFNLIPIPPLDGSKILAMCLPPVLRVHHYFLASNKSSG